MTPGAIAPPPGRFPQAQILRGAQREAEFLPNHPGRDDWASHDIVDKGREPRGGEAAGELARQQGGSAARRPCYLEPGLDPRRCGRTTATQSPDRITQADPNGCCQAGLPCKSLYGYCMSVTKRESADGLPVTGLSSGERLPAPVAEISP